MSDLDIKRLVGEGVYFIQQGEDGPVKIGYTTSIQNRLASLQTGSPYELKLLGFYEGTIEQEKTLHQLFAEERINGEWFDPTPELLATATNGSIRLERITPTLPQENGKAKTFTSAQLVETIYKGIGFRSELQARWAVFYDYLGVLFKYNQEVFELPDGLWYVPDFWLPEQKRWVKIYDNEPTCFERDKASSFADIMCEDFEQAIYIFYGDMEPFASSSYSAEVFYGPFCDLCHYWCECPVCGCLGITFEGRADYLPCHCEGRVEMNYDSPRLIEAYTRARQMKF